MKRQNLRFFTFVLLTFGLSFSLNAQSEKINMGDRFQINKDASYVTFETSFAGFPAIRGAFSAYQANIFYRQHPPFAKAYNPLTDLWRKENGHQTVCKCKHGNVMQLEPKAFDHHEAREYKEDLTPGAAHKCQGII